VKLLLTAAGAFLLSIAAADLKDARVCHWLARKLILRASLRLPRSERARWQEEWLRHDLDVPRRVLPLARAVQIFLKAGRWGRMLRGAPSRSEAMKARLRAAWQKLRSRPEAPPQEPQPEPAAARAEAEPALAAATAGSASVLLGLPGLEEVLRAPTRQPRPIPLDRAQREFLQRVAKEQREFQEWADGRQRDFEEWIDRERREINEWFKVWGKTR
jgi:hypothetical protein